MEINLINLVDYTGTFVFAVSGVLAGVERKFDLFGVFILGLVTAIGGGTLRDILIGSTPVGWMKNEVYIYLILAAIPFCYVLKDRVNKLKRSFFLFDTIGIGLFTILGLKKTLAFGLSPMIAVMMGIVSAVFGGVIRDVLSNKEPLIFSKEVYAFACLAGALVFLAAQYLVLENIAIVISICVVITIRILAIRFHWSVPFTP
ncbi:MAG: trimeric intracellular cation channel family protein [Saprospiraceae bacterium]|nr:trimeric intracellular cation channel family protein [Saprospiraceae bacterium]